MLGRGLNLIDTDACLKQIILMFFKITFLIFKLLLIMDRKNMEVADLFDWKNFSGRLSSTFKTSFGTFLTGKIFKITAFIFA